MTSTQPLNWSSHELGNHLPQSNQVVWPGEGPLPSLVVPAEISVTSSGTKQLTLTKQHHKGSEN